MVSLLLFQTISESKRVRGGEGPTSLYFNKIPVLATLRLAERGVTVPLPYSWYRYGPEVESFPWEVTFATEFKVDEQGIAPKTEDEPERELDEEYVTIADWRAAAPDQSFGDTTADAIRSEVHDIVSAFVSTGEPELLVDELYSRAPYDFQRLYRLVRMNLRRTGLGSAFRERAESSDLWTLFSDAASTFPTDEFPQLTVWLQATKELVNYSWNRLDRKDRQVAAEAVEQFWTAFSSALRVSPEGHSASVEKQALERWTADAERDSVRLQRAVGDLAIRVAEQDSDVRLDAVLGPILEQREAERKIARAEIAEALQDAGEILSFISGS